MVVFDKSHFLIKDDSEVPSGTHRHYSFTGYLDGLNRRACGGDGWHLEQVARFFPCLASVCYPPTRNRQDSHMLLYTLNMTVTRL